MLNDFPPSSAGELTNEELERVVVILQNPRQYKIPDWFLNRQKDIKDGKYTQVVANSLDNKLREDLERVRALTVFPGCFLRFFLSEFFVFLFVNS